jgi:hypothetical protein
VGQIERGQLVTLTALALNLDENGEIFGSLAIPRSERSQKLKTVASRADGNNDRSAVGRRRLEGIYAGVVSTRGELIASGIREFEGFAIRTGEGVSQGVEAQVSSKGHSSDNIGGSNESVGSRVSVVTAGEVTVVGGDDWERSVIGYTTEIAERTRVGLSLLDVLPIPLTDTRTTSVGKDDTTDVFKGTDLTVPLNRSTDLFRTGSDSELALDVQAMIGSLLGDGSRARHVLVRRVCA